MPLPLILWGAAAALAATGVVKGTQAVSTMNDAKELGERAERRHRSKIKELDKARDDTNKRFEELGQLKVEIFTHQIKHIIDVIKKTKGSSSTLKNFENTFSTEELKQMEQMVARSVELERGLLTGAAAGTLAGFGAYSSVGILATASTGTAISTLSGVAATNATLAWLGGGSLAAGGFGMAGGMIALGGIVAGPALAIGGFMLASKAEEAMTAARQYRDEVDVAIEKIENGEVLLASLRENADELTYALIELVDRFESVKVDDATDDQAFNKMIAMGKAIKSLLDTNIMNEDGTPVVGVKQTCTGLAQC